VLTNDKVKALLALTNEQSQPNINALWQIAKDLEGIKLNLKFFGYELAQSLVEALPAREGVEAQSVGLGSKACTQADMESDWAAYWCSELKVPLAFHRKLWEFAYVLQALHEHGMIGPQARGLGFGCGEEPIASYLASRGAQVVVTDLAPEDRQSAGWAQSHQHTTHLAQAFQPRLVSEEDFRLNVSLEYVDMNHIPVSLAGFDYCWSICALEHLGSLTQGLDFVERSISVLKPGGVAVHTTEFNYLNDEETIDNWGTVLYQKRHFQEIHDRLVAKGHRVMPLDFNIGSKPMDKFIDLPPFLHDWPDPMKREWAAHLNHLKAMVDGFASTCFGLIVVKG
jgi:2-polyprenyl-3-methyl-5-hydroxy-6-metoxy-1,4-benzoquinol methylase